MQIKIDYNLTQSKGDTADWLRYVAGEIENGFLCGEGWELFDDDENDI